MSYHFRAFRNAGLYSIYPHSPVSVSCLLRIWLWVSMVSNAHSVWGTTENLKAQTLSPSSLHLSAKSRLVHQVLLKSLHCPWALWADSSPSVHKQSQHDSHAATQQSHSLLLPGVSFPLPSPHLVLQAPKTVHQERECFANLLATVGCGSNTNQHTSVYWDSCSRHKQDQTLVSFRSAARLQAVLPTAKVQPSPQASIGSLHSILANLDKFSLFIFSYKFLMETGSWL